MSAENISEGRRKALYEETIELLQSLDSLAARLNSPNCVVKYSEAEQSLDCLRSDLTRIWTDFEETQTFELERREEQEPTLSPKSSMLPILLGGIALGAVIEKSLGGAF